jgi:hypothetical protein
MYAVASPFLPAFDSSYEGCAEVIGEIVDANCLGLEEYAEFLSKVVSPGKMAMQMFLTLLVAAGLPGRF